MFDCIVVGIGGFIGAVYRYLIGLIPVNEEFTFPIKTFCINVIGCFLIGTVIALAARNNSINPRMILFLKVGICGGFTTFSSFALETDVLIKNGNVVTAAFYCILSIFAGVMAVFAAETIIKN